MSGDFLGQDEVDQIFRQVTGGTINQDIFGPKLQEFLEKKKQTVQFMKQMFDLYLDAGFTSEEAVAMFKIDFMNDKRQIKEIFDQLPSR